MPVLRTTYELSYPTRAFYSVERTGFTTVTELFQQLVNDMLFTGAYALPSTAGSVFFTERATGAESACDWPPLEREFKIAEKGTGYNVGDYLILRDFGAVTSRRFAIKVTKVTNTDSAIDEYATFAGPTYSQISNTQPTLMGYSSGASLSISPSTSDPVGSYDASYSTGDFTNSGYLVVNTQGGDPNHLTNLSDNQLRSFSSIFGARGALKTGAVLGPTTTTWPTNDTIWFFDDEKTNTIKKGQEIFCTNPSANTSIPAGTTITDITLFDITVSSSFNPYNGYYYSNNKSCYSIKVSQAVSIQFGEKIYVRGIGASFTSNTTVVPNSWSVIVESKGAGDILSDGAPINCNVHASSGTTLIVKNMTTVNPYMPEIYPGMRLTSQLLTGTVTGTVYVKEVNKANIGWANVTLTSSQTITVNEPVKFTWDTLQPYRIRFNVKDSQTAEIYVGTEIQIPVGGKISYVWNATGTEIVDIAGILGNVPTKIGNVIINDKGQKTTISSKEPNPNSVDQGFINRSIRIGATKDKTNFSLGSPEAYPMSYTMTITRRGIFFGIWESNWSVMQRTKSANDAFFNWCLIQRPVDRVTGRTLVTGRSPVFCINSVGYKYWKFIVRESDSLHPTVGDPTCKSYVYNDTTNTIDVETTPYRTPADRHSQDSAAIINSSNQIALTEESKFLISFLNNLTTPRFRYSEELDLVSQTSADVCMATNDISITAYKESGPRTYRAMPSNNPYNTGMRIAILKDLPPYVDQPVI